MVKRVLKILVGILLIWVFSSASFAQDIFVAGVNADQRAANAPVIKTVRKPQSWYSQALKGVSTPYPYSLHFLENQGNWFNPFLHPGMHGRYDIRGWHKSKIKSD